MPDFYIFSLWRNDISNSIQCAAKKSQQQLLSRDHNADQLYCRDMSQGLRKCLLKEECSVNPAQREAVDSLSRRWIHWRESSQGVLAIFMAFSRLIFVNVIFLPFTFAPSFLCFFTASLFLSFYMPHSAGLDWRCWMQTTCISIFKSWQTGKGENNVLARISTPVCTRFTRMHWDTFVCVCSLQVHLSILLLWRGNSWPKRSLSRAEGPALCALLLFLLWFPICPPVTTDGCRGNISSANSSSGALGPPRLIGGRNWRVM